MFFLPYFYFYPVIIDHQELYSTLAILIYQLAKLVIVFKGQANFVNCLIDQLGSIIDITHVTKFYFFKHLHSAKYMFIIH